MSNYFNRVVQKKTNTYCDGMKRLSFLLVISSLRLFADVQYWVDASFTYWYAKEDGLNSAESAQVDGSATTVFASHPAVFQQSFGYHPGFKVGIGLSSGYDWMLSGEYTYYHGKNSVSRNAPAGSVGVGVWNVDSWYNQKTFYSDQSLTGTTLATTWKIMMNMGDLLLSLPFSKNAGFVFVPLGGIRAIGIQQHMNLELTQAGISFGGDSFLESQPLSSKNRSNSWGIGPRLGVDGRFNLPMGFNLDGLIGATLFFYKFTKVEHKEEAASTYYDAPASIKMSYDSVRPEIDLSLGFGWGMDICKKQRIDLVFSYDFSYFWGQNMMRYLVDECFAGTSAGSLDLYFQGLTFRASYGF